MCFGLTYKYRCVVHSHRTKGTSNVLISDNTYLTYIKKFLNDSTEKAKNNSKFWNVLKMFLNVTSIADIVGYKM